MSPARIIPGVYTEVRAVGLATSLPFGLNTVGIVGTAEKGDIDTPVLISSKQEMYETFGEPGEYRSSSVPEGSELTLVRAGALAFDGGAPQIYFVRIASSNAAAATRYITADDGTGSAGGYCAALTAKTVGEWGNNIKYKVETADGQTTLTGHVEAVGATVENTFDQSASDPGSYLFDTYDGQVTPDSTRFTFLSIPSANTFEAVASSSTSVVLQRSSSSNYQRTSFDVIHFDGGYFKTSGDVDMASSQRLDGATDQYSQSFWTIDGFTMTGVLLRLKTDGSTSGTITVKLYEADDNDEPTGSALASSAAYNVSGVGASFETVEISFSSSYTLSPMTKYCIVIENAITSGYCVWGGGSTSDEYTDGAGKFSSNSGSTWVDITNGNDFLFHPVFDIPENTCVFVINDWGTGFLSSYKKKIIWSEVAGNAPDASADTLYFTYETAHSMKVTIQYGETQEVYYVVDGYDLINDINDSDNGSSLVTADEPSYGSGQDYPDRYPMQTSSWQYFGVGAGDSGGTATLGNNGADVSASDYADGLDQLMTVDAHVIVCAGQYSPNVHAALQTHVDNASAQKKERIGICGHRYGQTLDQIMSSNVALSSKRMVFVSPGVETTNHQTGEDETVSAAYTAALLAGFLTQNNPSVSPLGKGVSVGGLETEYTNAQLEQLIKRKILPIRVSPSGGYKWADSMTASPDSSWREITTVRITDYATIGIRLACENFIGKKNLTSERNSIRTAVVSFMENMKADQMLDDEDPYTVQVSATREDRVQGIVRVDVSFKPVFSIKYVLVTEYVS